MQTAGYLVGILVEFSAGMEHGEDDLKSALAVMGHDVNRDTSPVVVDRYRAVPVNDNQYQVTEPGESLVYGVVHNFVDQVVQPPGIRAADVHGRTFPHRLQTFQYLDMRSIVGISHL